MFSYSLEGQRKAQEALAKQRLAEKLDERRRRAQQLQQLEGGDEGSLREGVLQQLERLHEMERLSAIQVGWLVYCQIDA